MLSQIPRYSTVFLFRSQSEMKKSPSLAFSISVSEINSLPLSRMIVISFPYTLIFLFFAIHLDLIVILCQFEKTRRNNWLLQFYFTRVNILKKVVINEPMYIKIQNKNFKKTLKYLTFRLFITRY